MAGDREVCVTLGELASINDSSTRYSRRVEQHCLDLDALRARVKANPEDVSVVDVVRLIDHVQEGSRLGANYALLTTSIILAASERADVRRRRTLWNRVRAAWRALFD